MIDTVPDILARIVAHKQQVAGRRATPLEALEQRAEQMRAGRRDFRGALAGRAPAIISEMKKASPSRGVLAPDFDPVRLAREYQRGGAAALSVLTDETFFQGKLEHLSAAREASALPVLRKDFTLDAYDVIEAAAHGADAILLIAAILEEKRMVELRRLAEQYEMAALVEVHDARELEIALATGAELVGVNNRNLKTFEVSLDTSLGLARKIPAGVLKVSESGIRSAADLRRLADAGFDAFLVGEHLIEAPSPSEALRALLGPS